MHVTLSHCPSEYQIKVLFPEHEIGSKAVNIVWLQILVGVVLSKYISFRLTGHAYTSHIKLNTDWPARNKRYSKFLLLQHSFASVVLPKVSFSSRFEI